jgi:signal transduction histidine kinase
MYVALLFVCCVVRRSHPWSPLHLAGQWGGMTRELGSLLSRVQDGELVNDRWKGNRRMQPALFAHTPWFDYLKDHLLPRVLAQARGQRQALRIWSVGCQTGDEAPVLALALHALLREQMAAWQIRIFATDLDPLTLACARQRVYPDPPPGGRWWQEGFPGCEITPQGYRLTKALRNTIIFAPHDLLYQPPFPHLNLIVCHTPLASWALDAQTIVLNRFAYTLAAHQYLWLVAPGMVSPDPDFWQCPDADWQLYRRIPSAIPLRCLQWKRPPAFLESAASPDQQADLYMEELQASLEEREVTYQELEQRMEEVEQANQRLAHLNRLKEDFLSMASHELRTPLTSLLAYTDLLRRLLEREGSQRTVQYVSRMQAQLEKLNRLVSDLLDISKVQAGKLVYTKERVLMDELVREVVENVQLTAARHRIVIEAGTTCEVIGDRDRLGQVVINLLSNAIKYSPQAEQVLVRLACSPEEIIVSVQDFGIGIPSDSQERVFERFYRGSSDVEQRFPGLGIGLYIAHQIIGHHAGRIWVESVQGQGSTFSFALPLKRGGLLFQKEQVMEKYILVVDDDPAILDVVQTILTGEG